jgi:hypothetical protein
MRIAAYTAIAMTGVDERRWYSASARLRSADGATVPGARSAARDNPGSDIDSP